MHYDKKWTSKELGIVRLEDHLKHEPFLGEAASLGWMAMDKWNTL